MKKIVFQLFIITGLLPVVNAQEVTVNLKQLINQSFGYFPKLKELEQQMVMSREKESLVSISEKPYVFGSASYSYLAPVAEAEFSVGPDKTQTLQFQPYHNLNTYAGINYTLFDFGRLKANIEKCKRDYELATNGVEAGKNQLAAQVAGIYYNIIYFKKAIQIQDSLIGYLQENLKLVESKLRNGDALKIDLLNLQAQIDAEANRKVDFTSQLEKQKNLMYFTTGSRETTGLLFDFKLATPTTTEALAKSQEAQPDFTLAKNRIALAKSDIDIAKLQDKPTVSLLGTAGIRNGYQPDIKAIRFNYLAGIGLNIPLYTGGRAKQQTKIAEAAVHQYELAANTLQSVYEKDIAQALEDIKSNLQRLGNTQSQIVQAKEAAQLATNRFRGGVATNLEITTAAALIQRAEFQALQYQFQLNQAYVELARLEGIKYW